MKIYSRLKALLISCFVFVHAIEIDPDNPNSVKSAVDIVINGMLSYYAGTQGGEVGLFLPPVYWWEGGAAWGALINYFVLTGDDKYNNLILDGLYSQIGENENFLPQKFRLSQGNDDQAFWTFASLSAAENNFPEREGFPSWLALSQIVFEDQMRRWDFQFCGGGLRWQIYSYNPGYEYKNTISNGALFQIAARLAFFTGDNMYIEKATMIYDWCKKVNFIDDNYIVLDGAHSYTNCTDTDNGQWSYNTNDQIWHTRIVGFLNRAREIFFKNSVVYEPACEPYNSCNSDKEAFKGFLSRWIMSVAQLFPEEFAGEIDPLLKQSAKITAAACIGGADGKTCGRVWYENEMGWDGHASMSIQLAALETIQASLWRKGQSMKTSSTGGTSKADPQKGQRKNADNDELTAAEGGRLEYRKAKNFERGIAGFITAAFGAFLIAFTAYLII